jgi:hypothetical protein
MKFIRKWRILDNAKTMQAQTASIVNGETVMAYNIRTRTHNKPMRVTCIMRYPLTPMWPNARYRLDGFDVETDDKLHKFYCDQIYIEQASDQLDIPIRDFDDP